jgi:hypothetical protein
MIRSLDLICAITKAVEELRMASKVPPYLGLLSVLKEILHTSCFQNQNAHACSK